MSASRILPAGRFYGTAPRIRGLPHNFGYRLHALITIEGYITTFEITLSYTDDREGLQDIVEHQARLVVLGDKGYVGKSLTEDMAGQGICLMALKRF